MKQEMLLWIPYYRNLLSKCPKPGDVVSGIVVTKEQGYLLISVGGVAVGIIAGTKMRWIWNYKNYKQETRLSAFVLDEENEDSVMVLFPPKKQSQMKTGISLKNVSKVERDY